MAPSHDVILFAGVVTLKVDSSYRQGGAHPHPAATHDLEDVARFARCSFSPWVLLCEGLGHWDAAARAVCSFGQKLQSRISLVPTPARLKLLHACDQWHSSRVFTPLTGWHVKFRPNTEGL